MAGFTNFLTKCHIIGHVILCNLQNAFHLSPNPIVLVTVYRKLLVATHIKAIRSLLHCNMYWQ